MGGVFCAELFLCYFLTVTDHGWCVLCWTPPVLLSNCDWLWLTITCHDWPLRMRSVWVFFSFFFFFCGEFFLYCFLTLADSDLLWLCAVAIPAHVIFWLWLMLDTVCSVGGRTYQPWRGGGGHNTVPRLRAGGRGGAQEYHPAPLVTAQTGHGPHQGNHSVILHLLSQHKLGMDLTKVIIVSSCTSCHSSNWAWTSPR